MIISFYGCNCAFHALLIFQISFSDQLIDLQVICSHFKVNVMVFILVDDFRSISLQLVQSHFRTAVDQGKVNRIEVLPISWHTTLHGEDTGIDRKLKSITLSSISKLRHFTNDTLLDILFYTSPVYCQVIIGLIFCSFVAHYFYC